MVNPRTSTEFWDASDEDELEVPLHYPNATRRRMHVAHALGIIGVLGTLALGVAAVLPHASYFEQRAHSLFSHETPPAGARPVLQVAPPVADVPAPVVTPEAAPVVTPLAAMAPDNASPAQVIPQVAETAAAVPAPAAAPLAQPESPPAAETTAPTAPSAMPAAPASTPPTAAVPPAADAPAVAAPAAAPAEPRRAAAAAPSRTEPRLTWREIERRKERYADWLKQQGLEPVH